MRSVLRVLLPLLANESELVILARKWGDSGYRQFDLSFTPRMHGWFSPWFLTSMSLYELAGLLWCVMLRLRGVKKFLVQDAVFSGLFTSLVCHATGGQFYLFDYGSAVNADTGLLERELSAMQPARVARLQLKVMRMIRWLSMRSCKVFFVHSSELKALARNSGLHEDRISEYRFPVDPEVYRRDAKARLRFRRKLGLGKCFCLLYAGRMTIDKGLPILAQAYSKLVKEYAGRLRLLMVGSGTEKAALMEMCEGLEGVIFVDAVENPSRLAELMSAADAFAYPIVYSGGLAMAVLEAMACRLPVIVGPAGPTKDLIVDGGSGFVMREAEPDYIAVAVRYLIQHPRIRSRMGRRARETVMKGFSIEQYKHTVLERILE